MRISPDAVDILEAAPVPHAPRTHLHPPAQNDTAAAGPLLVARVLDTAGHEIDAWAWPGESVRFEDMLDGADALRGRAQAGDTWEARWRLPLGPEAARLVFERTIPATGPVVARTVVQGDYAVDDLRARPILERWDAGRTPDGYPKEARTLHHSGTPETCFDIVVLGDGFAVDEQVEFLRLAGIVTQALTRTRPFSDVADLINVHAVSVVSTDSGIKACPAGQAERRTYFRTEGYFRNTPSPTFIGTDATDRVSTAIGLALPPALVNLTVMIVNCGRYGGSAPLDLGMIFVTADADDRNVRLVTTHEAGHAIAHLAEEYNPCNRRTPGRVYPNEATAAQVAEGRLPWQDLLTADERDADGRPVVVHRLGMPQRDRKPNRVPTKQPDLPEPANSALGAFWGAHSGEPPADGLTPPSLDCSDARGASFYRPMAECRMRRLDWEFCRVCAARIVSAIRDAAGQA
ncbi:MAG: M64 family metallopeptidase [Vicinamibacterales bacterium]